jgi:type IV secretory pathway VirB2 component (pilin)
MLSVEILLAGTGPVSTLIVLLLVVKMGLMASIDTKYTVFADRLVIVVGLWIAGVYRVDRLL